MSSSTFVEMFPNFCLIFFPSLILRWGFQGFSPLTIPRFISFLMLIYRWSREDVFITRTSFSNRNLAARTYLF